MKKYLALLLCLMLCLTAFVACGGTEEVSKEESKAEASTAEASAEPSVEESSVDPDQAILDNPDIYKGSDYEDRVFTIWTANTTAQPTYYEFLYNEDVAENVLPETVNIAIRDRNNKVHDAIGVTIEEVYFQDYGRYSSKALTQVRNFISTSEASINMLDICLYDCGTLAVEGSLYDLNTLENINLSNPWWEQYFNESVTVGGQTYFTLGDIGFNNKSAPVIFYNPRLIEELGLDDPINLAKAGTWTIDKAIEYSRANCIDSADPEGMDYKDDFGWAGQYDDMYAMVYGAGVRILTPDSTGYPELTLNNETTIGVVDKVINFMKEDSYMCGNDFFSVSDTPMVLLMDAFENGRCLFYSGGVGTAVEFEMQNNDIFGILPVPKYDEEQESYYSLINTWTTNAFCIATNLSKEDAEFTAAVMDVMGYYSWQKYPDSVAFNYYEKMLKNQKLSREDSEAILDLVFEARGCELGSILQVGKLSGSKMVNDVLIELMDSRTVGGFVSKYETYGNIFERDVETIREFFAMNEE